MSNLQTISGNGNGAWTLLAKGLNRISFHSGTWSTTTIALEYADDISGTRPNVVFLPDHSAAFSATSATYKQIFLYGDGESAVRPVTTSYGGTAVTMKVTVVAPATNEGV